jgi:iron complex outermembrane receptor protein
VPATYPGNTTGRRQVLQYNFSELGGNRTGVESDTYRLGADLTGKWSGWDLTAAIGASESKVRQEINNQPIIPNLQAAFNDPVHPYLVGAAAVNNTQAQRDFIYPLETSNATSKLQFIRVSAGRELMTLPGGPLALNLGAEYTHRALDSQAPPSVANGTQFGNNAWAIGTQNIAAGYGEIVAPVLKNLELDASVRYDKVMGIDKAVTPKAGFKWSPIRQVTLRGTYTEGFRAPNPAEFGNTGSAFIANFQPDPLLCANAGDDPTTTPGNFPLQCNIQVSGVQTPGKNLKSETSRSYTFGLILEPVRNVNVSVDYYRIRIDNQIISALNDPAYDPTPFYVRGVPIPQPFVNPDGTLSTVTPPVGNLLYAPYPYVNALYTMYGRRRGRPVGRHPRSVGRLRRHRQSARPRPAQVRLGQGTTHREHDGELGRQLLRDRPFLEQCLDLRGCDRRRVPDAPAGVLPCAPLHLGGPIRRVPPVGQVEPARLGDQPVQLAAAAGLPDLRWRIVDLLQPGAAPGRGRRALRQRGPEL